ncbi:hypothetical protein PhCBS80983_g00676 [Powellomyces hirtus]|uniref:Nucleoporin Nup82 n=1 Tax=Powellomyces hirtus TaxID=109895 RepID=A0A507EFP1_9FUNG|nr:hypothetical protein PhCBS80983_g00676 [Powellomyces hirtus]
MLPPPGFWLQSLSLHPVLDLASSADDSNFSQVHEAPDTTLPDLSIIAPEYTEGNILDIAGIDLHGDCRGSRPPRRESLIVVHEGLAVVCLISRTPKIRLLNLRKWKGLLDETKDDLQAALEHADYKELAVPGVNFRVNQMELNGTGRYLALVGDNDVTVVVLPRAIWTDAKREVVPTTSMRLDLMNYSQIAKVQWHPLSEKQTHLMVLSTDGTLWMHDVTAGAHSLERSYHFIGSSDGLPPSRTNRAGMFGPDLDEEEFVSFCSGRNDGKWGSMTVYGVTRSGDAYSLCPVLPKRSILKPEILEELRMENAATQLEQSSLGQYSQTQYYWRSTMIDEMLVESRHQLESLPGEPVAVMQPRTTITLKTKALGPHLLRPAADVGVDFDNATDIMCLQTSSLDVLVLAFRSGMLRVCMDIEGPKPLWHITAPPTQEESALPFFMVAEDIDLALSEPRIGSHGSRNEFTSLVSDPRSPHVLYSYHSQGVHCINVERLIGGLESLASSPAPTNMLEAKILDEMGDDLASEVTLLISTGETVESDEAAVIGFAVITETSLGYSYILMTSLPQLYGDVLAVPVKYRGRSSTKGKAAGYTPALEAPLFQSPSVMRKSAPGIVLPDGAPINQPLSKSTHIPTLWAFFEHIKARRSDLLDRHYAVLDLERRVIHQEVEMKKQQGLIQLWEDLIDNRATEQIEKMQEKLEKLRLKEYVHRKRLGLMLQILMDETQPLTEAEQKWIKELAALQKSFNDKMRPFKEKVESQLEALHEKRDNLRKQRDAEYATAQAPDLGDTQRRRIEAALKQEYALLVTATQKVVRLKETARKVEDTLRYHAVQKTPQLQQ